MKRCKVVLVAALFLVVLGSVAAVHADTGGPPNQDRGPHPRPLRGLRGEVTAVSATGLTVLTRQQVSVQVNVGVDTKVWLVETQSQGSLEDIEVGDHILAQGRRAKGSAPGGRQDDVPAMDARRIVVAPEGDEVHGQVTAVEGGVITLATRQPENPEGEATIVTDDNTTFRLGREEGSLDDVTEGKHLVAFGEFRSDGSLLARLVIIDNWPPPPPPVRTLRGEVTAVGATGLTILTGNEMSVQVNVAEDTRMWLAETQSRSSLEDVEVGDHVLARGTRAEGSAPGRSQDGAPAMDARHIVVAPDGDEVHGRVTAVEGGVITLATRQPDAPEGEATVVTSEDTAFRIRIRCGGWREGSLEDVTEGQFVVAFGETQSNGSLLARLVYLHPGPPPGPDAEAVVGRQGGDHLPDLRLGSHPDELPEDLWVGAL